jgi:hypothetical protein
MATPSKAYKEFKDGGNDVFYMGLYWKSHSLAAAIHMNIRRNISKNAISLLRLSNKINQSG